MSDLIDKRGACATLGGISEATLWRGVKSGRFPAPIKLGRFIARWQREELAACVEKLAAERAV
jgi:predicted DNA-binding transcriptional regulator AlpA